MKKVLIRAPGSKEHILSSYLIVHHLFTVINDVKIFIVIDEELEKYYSLLPFPVHIQVLSCSVQSMSQIHKFAYNLHDIFNVDYYLDLQETRESAYFGKAFKAKERYGFKGGFVRNLFINNLIQKDENTEIDGEYLKLLSESGLVASEMSLFSGNEDKFDLELVFKNIVFLLDEFSYKEGIALKFIKDTFPEASITLFSENEAIEIKDVEICHDFHALKDILKQSNLCVTNSPFFYGILKYMKSKFISLQSFDNKFAFFLGSAFTVNFLDNGKIEHIANKETTPLEKDSFQEELELFFETN